ncbi:hypothetical protein RintRC_1923 [Richelia intracellularis]|nr:hypothetical protein RintRC_1923 [Richelia intracellularis]
MPVMVWGTNLFGNYLNFQTDWGNEPPINKHTGGFSIPSGMVRVP